MLEKYLEDILWCFETDAFIYGKFIKIISKVIGVPPKKIGKVFILLSLLLLINPDTSRCASNIILLIPIITITLFSSFNKIKFDNNDIFVYWSLYSILSILDPLLQVITPLYYILKVFAISFIYLGPFKFGNRLKDDVMRTINIIGTRIEKLFNKYNTSNIVKRQSKKTFTNQNFSKSKSNSTILKIPKNKESTGNSKSNPSTLLRDNNNNLPSNEISENILYASPGDVAFSIDKYLTISKSFTREVSEYVYIQNFNSLNPIAINIKTNAPNYVNANPGKGIIEAGKKQAINVLLKPLPEGVKINSIIIVIEYNIIPIETKTFSSNLIDGRYRKIFKLRQF